MKKMLFIFSFAYIFLGCKSDDCSDIFCTQEFVTINISIKNQSNNPVSLDYFEVINLKDGSDLTREVNSAELELMQQNGTYPLFGDEHVNAYKNQKLEIQFKGFSNNQKIISQNYTVGADCCHVILISGVTELILE